MLWQSAYAEYEFVDTLWPDFTAPNMADILLAAYSGGNAASAPCRMSPIRHLGQDLRDAGATGAALVSVGLLAIWLGGSGFAALIVICGRPDGWELVGMAIPAAPRSGLAGRGCAPCSP